jgi:predicted GNAT family acetyltransferase
VSRVTALLTRRRRLVDADLAALRRLMALDPVANCTLIARLDGARTISPRGLSGEAWGADDPSGAGLAAACFWAGSVVPVGSAEALPALAEELAAEERSGSVIVGSAEAVAAVWPVLRPGWGAARSERLDQPLLTLGRVPEVRADPAVRVVRRGELGRYLLAAEAMFAEEVGRPVVHGRGERAYRAHHERLVAQGRALARFDERGAVVFKAEIAAVTAHCTQIQGVWVAPAWRGRGIATTGMAAVLRHALRYAPVASLYVNAYNLPARRLYGRLGMTEIGRMSTVLF